jgi:hypothetical protein
MVLTVWEREVSLHVVKILKYIEDGANGSWRERSSVARPTGESHRVYLSTQSRSSDAQTWSRAHSFGWLELNVPLRNPWRIAEQLPTSRQQYLRLHWSAKAKSDWRVTRGSTVWDWIDHGIWNLYHGTVGMERANGDGVDRFGRRKQATTSSRSMKGSREWCLKRSRITQRISCDGRGYLAGVPTADHDYEVVLVGEPVEKPRERTYASNKHSCRVAYRQVDHSDAWSLWPFLSVAFEHPVEASMDEIHEECVARNNLFAREHIMRNENWSNVDRLREGRARIRQVAVGDERSHASGMILLTGSVYRGTVIRVVYDQAAFQCRVVGHGDSVEQR